MREISLQSWDHFKRDYSAALDKRAPMIENFVYRGQADSNWSIESSFDRVCPSGVLDRQAYYEKMLSFFAYQLRQYGEDLDRLTRQERGAIAQHYGMPTRLIDWSRSPYVAAFMAFSSALTEKRVAPGTRVAIWALDLTHLKMLTSDAATPFKRVKTRMLKNDRVWRQAGLFVEATGDPRYFDRHIDDIAAGAENGLIKFTIPSDEAVVALNDLILMGLTPATIYPDRDGAAKYVRLRMELDQADGEPSRRRH